MLILTLAKNERNHNMAVLPLLADILSRLNAKAASKRPPTIKNIQLIIISNGFLVTDAKIVFSD